MSIVKWSPVKEIDEMRKDIESLFNEFLDPTRRRRHWWPKPSEVGLIVPNVEMYDRKGEIIIKAEVPGVSKENINLTISKDSVSIKGEMKKEEEIKEEDYYRAERTYGSFSRTIALPVEVDSAKAKASYKNGVLEIVLPKKEESKPTEIKIDVS